MDHNPYLPPAVTDRNVSQLCSSPKGKVIIWSIGLLMPAWLFLVAAVFDVAGIELSGKWVYISVLSGGVVCSRVAAGMNLSLLRRLLLIVFSWVLLCIELFVIGIIAVLIYKFEGIQ